MMNQVKVYGADWCEDTKRTRQHLHTLGVAHEYINIEQDQSAAEWVRTQNDGKERKPTVQVGAQVLSVPSDHELEDALRQEGLIS
jgi:glutaredoxin